MSCIPFSAPPQPVELFVQLGFLDLLIRVRLRHPIQSETSFFSASDCVTIARNPINDYRIAKLEEN